MEIGPTIRRLRESYDMTQEELARRVGMTAASVSMWESGRAIPRVQTLQKLADLFGTTAAVLMDEPTSPVPTGKMVPVLGWTHMGDAADPEECDLLVEVPSCVVDAHPGCFLVHAEGDCMDRRYPPDSLLLIDPRMEPTQGCAVLAELAEGRTVVRAYYRGATSLMLCADSTAPHEDVIVRADDPPAVLRGVVVWYQAERDVR